MTRYLLLPLLPLLALILFSCSREVNVQEVYPFEVELMPYHQEASIGQTIEMRCKLSPQKIFIAREYYIRKFQVRGKGSMLLNLGGVELLDNDLYDLAVGDFRLYYTPQSGNQHTIELVIADDTGQTQKLLLEFSIDNNTDNPSIEDNNMPPIGDVAEGENGNYYINGSDTGIVIKPGHDPVVTIIDGYYYIDGEKTPVPAPPHPKEPSYPDDVLVPTLQKRGKYEVLLISKAPETVYTDPTTHEQKHITHNGVRIEDGACLYQCLSPDSVPIPFASISGLPRIPDKQYRTDKNGCFVVPASDLPIKGIPETGVTKSIVVNGKQYASDSTTYVPSRVLVKLVYSHHEGSVFFFRLTQWDSEKEGGAFVPMNIALDNKTYGNPKNFFVWAVRAKSKGSGVKQDYCAIRNALVFGTKEGLIAVSLPHVSISDPSLPDYGFSERKPLFISLSMAYAPYTHHLQTMQLLGMAEKDFWDSFTDFFTFF